MVDGDVSPDCAVCVGNIVWIDWEWDDGYIDKINANMNNFYFAKF